MNHYTLEFIFEKRFWDSEFDVNYTDGFCEISCRVNGQGPISLDINDLCSDEIAPHNVNGDCFTHYRDNYHVIFEVDAEEFNISKACFRTYGRLGYGKYINIEVLCYDGKDYSRTDDWDVECQ